MWPLRPTPGQCCPLAELPNYPGLMDNDLLLDKSLARPDIQLYKPLSVLIDPLGSVTWLGQLNCPPVILYRVAVGPSWCNLGLQVINRLGTFYIKY